ncbi:MAG: hypothetical protein WBD58_02300 [Geitlerinemataceae cyanobacterium]
MNRVANFNIYLGDRCLQTYADPPEDPLNELSAFELGIRRFCYECNRPIYLEIGDDRLQLFLDPDICMLLDEELPEKVVKFENGHSLTLEFVESEGVRIEIGANADIVPCSLHYFGDNFNPQSGREKTLLLDRDRVLMTLKLFLYQITILARDSGYISPNDMLAFLKPTLVSGLEKTAIA